MKATMQGVAIPVGLFTLVLVAAAISEPMDDALPMEPLPTNGHYVPPRRTQVRAADVYPWVLSYFDRAFGQRLSKRQAATVLAQWAAETGWGKNTWNNNVGNVKAGRSYTQLFTVLPTWEYHNRGGKMVKERWRAPFRAYNTLSAGVDDWLRVVTGPTHGRSRQFITAADPEGLGRSLGNRSQGGTGYATASPDSYARALRANYDKIASAIG